MDTDPYRLRTSLSPSKNSGGRVGDCGRVGDARLPEGTDWPRCRICGAEMVAYFDVTLPAAGADPLLPESVLQVFACPKHDGIPGPYYSDYAPLTAVSLSEQLPDGYWDLTDGHYLLRLLRPPVPLQPAARGDEQLQPHFLSVFPLGDAAVSGLKLLGDPAWIQRPEPHRCSCGAPMALVLQVPEDHPFPIDAGSLPPGVKHNPYLHKLLLFLGNALYLLACTRQCDPRALWPVVQN